MAIKIIENGNRQIEEFVSQSLYKENKVYYEYVNKHNDRSYVIKRFFTVKDNGLIVGGAIGYIEYGWYHLDLIWINMDYRRKKIGTKLMARIEKMAKKRNCTGILTSTWNVNPTKFFEKMGFRTYNQLPDYPEGYINYQMLKRLKPFEE